MLKRMLELFKLEYKLRTGSCCRQRLAMGLLQVFVFREQQCSAQIIGKLCTGELAQLNTNLPDAAPAWGELCLEGVHAVLA